MENSQFNPSTHIPPSYDLLGYLKPEYKRKDQLSLLNQKSYIPTNWIHRTNESGASSRQELLSIRRQQKIPDISYDLDKDGYVGERDYFLSKLYDKDKDGKLNETEKQSAMEGIANGIENNFIWNVTNPMPQPKRKSASAEKVLRNKKQLNKTYDNIDKVPTYQQPMSKPIREAQPFRHFMQIRGKILEAENFLPIRETYPEHPLSKKEPSVSTYSELKQKRKQENLNSINNAVRNWESRNLSFLSDRFINYKHPTIKPLYSSKSEIKLKLHKDARIKCGLSPEEQEIGGYLQKAPSLAYIDNPKHITKADIVKDMKAEDLENNKKISNINHKSEIQRLNERENEIFAKLYSDKEGKTYSSIKANRKKELHENNIKKFSKQILGVHGNELPKFSESESMKEFWKHKEGYCEDPKYKSQVEYKESIKYWKESEELLLNEHRDEAPQSKDPFKKEHHPIDKNKNDKNMVLKVNNINHFPKFDPNVPFVFDADKQNKHIYRWTTLVNQFASNKFGEGRFFDTLPRNGSYNKLPHSERNKKENSKDEKLSSSTEHYGSDYLVKHLKNKFKGEMHWIKAEHDKAELYRTAKDCLFHKFSGKDSAKGNIPKGAIARAKGF